MVEAFAQAESVANLVQRAELMQVVITGVVPDNVEGNTGATRTNE